MLDEIPKSSVAVGDHNAKID